MTFLVTHRFEGKLFSGGWVDASMRQPVDEPASGRILFSADLAGARGLRVQPCCAWPAGHVSRHGGPANWEEFSHRQWVTIGAEAHAHPV